MIINSISDLLSIIPDAAHRALIVPRLELVSSEAELPTLERTAEQQLKWAQTRNNNLSKLETDSIKSIASKLGVGFNDDGSRWFDEPQLPTHITSLNVMGWTTTAKRLGGAITGFGGSILRPPLQPLVHFTERVMSELGHLAAVGFGFINTWAGSYAVNKTGQHKQNSAWTEEQLETMFESNCELYWTAIKAGIVLTINSREVFSDSFEPFLDKFADKLILRPIKLHWIVDERCHDACINLLWDADAPDAPPAVVLVLMHPSHFAPHFAPTLFDLEEADTLNSILKFLTRTKNTQPNYYVDSFKRLLEDDSVYVSQKPVFMPLSKLSTEELRSGVPTNPHTLSTLYPQVSRFITEFHTSYPDELVDLALPAHTTIKVRLSLVTQVRYALIARAQATQLRHELALSVPENERTVQQMLEIKLVAEQMAEISSIQRSEDYSAKASQKRAKRVNCPSCGIEYSGGYLNRHKCEIGVAVVRAVTGWSFESRSEEEAEAVYESRKQLALDSFIDQVTASSQAVLNARLQQEIAEKKANEDGRRERKAEGKRVKTWKKLAKEHEEKTGETVNEPFKRAINVGDPLWYPSDELQKKLKGGTTYFSSKQGKRKRGPNKKDESSGNDSVANKKK